jgi:hypothetical protein
MLTIVISSFEATRQDAGFHFESATHSDRMTLSLHQKVSSGHDGRFAFE